MTYQEVQLAARGNMGPWCKACPVCDGRACGNAMPGPGAKGVGDVAIRNYRKWQDVRVNMDVLTANTGVDPSLSLWGRTFRYPFFAGPVGAVKLHYGDRYDDQSYNDLLVSACREAGIAAFTGDGTDPEVFRSAAHAIGAAGGTGVPTVKPWNLDIIREKTALAVEAGAFALAMDVDAAGLPFLRGLTPRAGSKSVEELREIIALSGLPFVVKGIMTPAAAEKAARAGAAAIVVSNHGGRVLDQTPATAEVLPEIAQAVGGRLKIFVDGGIRSGVDLFKALALGADAALMARPFVVAVYGGGAEGVRAYVDKVGSELADTMAMCGAHSLAEICRDRVRL